MLRNSQSLARKAALLLATAATWWLAERLADKDSVEQKTDSSQIDYFATHIRRTALTAAGQPKDELFAERMTHFKHDDHTEMDKPVMTLHQAGGAPWIIRAAQATARAGGKQVLLQGEVIITHTDTAGEAIKIITANVTYLPDQDYAETAEAVEMLTADSRTRATGADVHFKPMLTINLHANVRRQHEMR